MGDVALAGLHVTCKGMHKHIERHVAVVTTEESEEDRRTEVTRLTDEVFRSLIISTNNLPHYRDPLWTRAKVRNAPPFSKYH